jgi:hypothetical protein
MAGMLRFALSALAMATVVANAAAAEQAKPASPQRVVVVELFTSQGCSSCPRANVVLGELARDPSIIALTYAVGYWDYLGWKDTFARPEFAARQKTYARAFKRGAYTPQMVIDGAGHVSGLKNRELQRMVGAATMVGGARIKARHANGVAQIKIYGPPPAAASEVWIAQYRPGREIVSVKRGENAGSKIVHHNVVTALTRLGEWTGGEERFESACAPACAVIVQEAHGGKIIAAQGATLSGV